jgi:hypothetical protein
MTGMAQSKGIASSAKIKDTSNNMTSETNTNMFFMEKLFPMLVLFILPPF